MMWQGLQHPGNTVVCLSFLDHLKLVYRLNYPKMDLSRQQPGSSTE